MGPLITCKYSVVIQLIEVLSGPERRPKCFRASIKGRAKKQNVYTCMYNVAARGCVSTM